MSIEVLCGYRGTKLHVSVVYHGSVDNSMHTVLSRYGKMLASRPDWTKGDKERVD